MKNDVFVLKNDRSFCHSRYVDEVRTSVARVCFYLKMMIFLLKTTIFMLTK